jgi:4-carboxymuconolactone decarboxylase
MARIPGVSTRQAGPLVRLAYFFTRRQLRALTGAERPGGIEPVELFAHNPKLLLGYGALEQATAGLRRVNRRLLVLAELKVATLTACEYCIDLGSTIARRSGLTDDELRALPTYRTSPLFDELDLLVLDYAVGMSRTPVDVPDQLFDRLRARFGPAELVELTHVIAVENLRGRFNLALGIGSAGFSDGAVCAVPEPGPQP